MAKSNGRLSAQQVATWFGTIGFDQQRAVLGELNQIHDRLRDGRISALRKELQELEDGPGANGGRISMRKANGKSSKPKVKFRDPKTGDTWSGRGRMASWLAEKVKGGEKADKYLV